MIRQANAALIVLLAGIGGAAATPSEVQSEMAPVQGEHQAAPKAITPAPEQTTGARRGPKARDLAQDSAPKPQPAAAAESPATPPAAQDRAASVEEQRYSFHRAKDSFLRLDSHTGQVTQCGWSATGWACSAVPDERVALESEIARLQGENVALKRSLLSHSLPLPANVRPDVLARDEGAPKKKAPELAPPPNAPSEADLDRAIAFVRNVWRRLVELMVDLQRDIQRKS